MPIILYDFILHKLANTTNGNAPSITYYFLIDIGSLFNNYIVKIINIRINAINI